MTLNKSSKFAFCITKFFSYCVKSVSRVIVVALPLPLLLKLVSFFRPSFLARLISSIQAIKIYDISILGVHFLVESGPRDDHYLDLEKNQIADWEDESLAVWIELCKHADFAIDVGAYLGIYSIVAAKVDCPRVLAIEPNPKTYEQLKKMLL